MNDDARGIVSSPATPLAPQAAGVSAAAVFRKPVSRLRAVGGEYSMAIINDRNRRLAAVRLQSVLGSTGGIAPVASRR